MHVPIPVENVRAALPNWGIKDAAFSELPRGATAEVWKVESERGTFVAKYAYDDRTHFENGLRAAEVALEAGIHSAAPLRTTDNESTVMLEWPTGHWHPLALLHWIDGTPFRDRDDRAVEEFARVHGSLQAALASSLPDTAGWDPFSYLHYLEDSSQDLGDDGELRAMVGRVAASARRFQESTPMTIAYAVWDGPEVLVDELGNLGLIDFGFCRPLPVVHAMANRSLHFGNEENERTRRFVQLYTEHFPLTDAELAAVPLFRQVSLAIYCKFGAGQVAESVRGGERRAQVKAYVDRHAHLLA